MSGQIKDYSRLNALEAVSTAIKQTDCLLDTLKSYDPSSKFFVRQYALRIGLAEARRLLEAQQPKGK